MKDDMGPMPAVHPRHKPMEQARKELLGLVIDLEDRYDLTLCESMSLLADMLSNQLGRCVSLERRSKE